MVGFNNNGSSHGACVTPEHLADTFLKQHNRLEAIALKRVNHSDVDDVLYQAYANMHQRVVRGPPLLMEDLDKKMTLYVRSAGIDLFRKQNGRDKAEIKEPFLTYFGELDREEFAYLSKDNSLSDISELIKYLLDSGLDKLGLDTLVSHYIEGISQRAIAKRLKLSNSRVCQIIGKAKRGISSFLTSRGYAD